VHLEVPREGDFVKSFLNFLKTTILGGLLVIVPLFLVFLVLTEAVDMVIAVVHPFAVMLPGEWVASERVARFLALGILLGLCFLIGLATRTRRGVSSGRWMERTVLQRVPGYAMAKTLTKQFTGGEGESRFAPAVLRSREGDLTLAYIIEEHDNGYFTLLLPSSPVGTAGSLRYVSGERVKRLQVPLSRVFNCVTQYGIGSGPLFIPNTPFAAERETDPK
jgi:uncharacterized membrane protein